MEPEVEEGTPAAWSTATADHSVYRTPRSSESPAGAGADTVQDDEIVIRVRTNDGAMEVALCRLEGEAVVLRATTTGTGDIFELVIDRESRGTICPRFAHETQGDAFLALLTRALSRVVPKDAAGVEPCEGRVVCEYSVEQRRSDAASFVLEITVRPHDELLDQPFGATLRLPLKHRASAEDKLRIVHDDIRREQDVLVHMLPGGGALLRAHPSDHALSEAVTRAVHDGKDFPWRVVGSAPLSLLQTLEIKTEGALCDIGALEHLPYVRDLSITITPPRKSYDAEVETNGYHPAKSTETAFLVHGDEGTGSAMAFEDVSVFSRGYCGLLESLKIVDNISLVNIDPIAELGRLVDLKLVGCTKVASAAALAKCPNLRTADFTNCTSLAELPACKTLVGIKLTHCTALSDLEPLCHTSVWKGSVVCVPSLEVPVDDVQRLQTLNRVFQTMHIFKDDGHSECASCEWPWDAKAHLPKGQTPHSRKVVMSFSGAPQVGIKITSGEGGEYFPGGTLNGVSVDLTQTKVTSDMLQVMCRWFDTLPSHGAVIKYPSFEPCGEAQSANPYSRESRGSWSNGQYTPQDPSYSRVSFQPSADGGDKHFFWAIPGSHVVRPPVQICWWQ